MHLLFDALVTAFEMLIWHIWVTNKVTFLKHGTFWESYKKKCKLFDFHDIHFN
jgi:hypothetical protein